MKLSETNNNFNVLAHSDDDVIFYWYQFSTLFCFFVKDNHDWYFFRILADRQHSPTENGLKIK